MENNKFSNYSKIKINEEPKYKETEKNNVEDLLNKYSNKSQAELLNEFLQLSKSKKEKGELDNTEINNIKNTLSGFLTEEQLKNLDNLINMVKK